MNRRFIPIGPQLRSRWHTVKSDPQEPLLERDFSGIAVLSNTHAGEISALWLMDTLRPTIEPHEARAIAEAFSAAADDVAAYKVKP